MDMRGRPSIQGDEGAQGARADATPKGGRREGWQCGRCCRWDDVYFHVRSSGCEVGEREGRGCCLARSIVERVWVGKQTLPGGFRCFAHAQERRPEAGGKLAALHAGREGGKLHFEEMRIAKMTRGRVWCADAR